MFTPNWVEFHNEINFVWWFLFRKSEMSFTLHLNIFFTLIVSPKHLWYPYISMLTTISLSFSNPLEFERNFENRWTYILIYLVLFKTHKHTLRLLLPFGWNFFNKSSHRRIIHAAFTKAAYERSVPNLLLYCCNFLFVVVILRE